MAIFTKKSEPKIELEQFPPRPSMVSAPPIPTAPARRVYGIGDAIMLMRSLPVDQNVDLIVQVIRATLASMNVRVQDIIEDARRKEQATEAGIQSLHVKVAELERELDARRKEIIGLEADLSETTAVKERLQLAESIASVVPSHPTETETPASNGQFAYPHGG
jgi:hypothetical protein